MSVESERKQPKLSIYGMIKTQQFISVFIMAFCSIFIGLFAVGNFKVFGESNQIHETALALIGSIGALFNSLRFIWSTLLDKYSYRSVYGSLLVIQIICAIASVHFAENKFLYAASYCGIMFCEGGHFTLVPNVLRQIFGEKSATRLYGIMLSYIGVSALL